MFSNRPKQYKGEMRHMRHLYWSIPLSMGYTETRMFFTRSHFLGRFRVRKFRFWSTSKSRHFCSEAHYENNSKHRFFSVGMSAWKIILSIVGYYSGMYYWLYTGWPKSHFTLLKANETKPNGAKKIGYISNERPYLGVFLLMKNCFIV